MADIAARLRTVSRRIAAAEQRYGRPAGAVTLLAVTKTVTPARIVSALEAGQHRFGESYVQEALPKIAALAEHAPEWHFIGPIQGNKAKNIATSFDWVHSLDRLAIARRLAGHRPSAAAPLNVCIQVNISGEASKSGITPADTVELALRVAELPRLRLRGLMAIPAPDDEFARQRAAFRQLRELLEMLRAQGLTMDTLSMGMSDDLEAAVAEGATIVRVGSAIFGARPSH